MAIDSLLKYSTRLCDLVYGMDETSMLADRTYKDMRGNTHTQPAWPMLLHCFNHSTQHRGQLITMMRSLQLEEASPKLRRARRGRHYLGACPNRPAAPTSSPPSPRCI